MSQVAGNISIKIENFCLKLNNDASSEWTITNPFLIGWFKHPWFNLEFIYSFRMKVQIGYFFQAKVYFLNYTCLSSTEICEASHFRATGNSSCINNLGEEITVGSLMPKPSTSIEEYWQRHVLGDTEEYSWTNFVRTFSQNPLAIVGSKVVYHLGSSSTQICCLVVCCLALGSILPYKRSQIYGKSCLLYITFSLLSFGDHWH